MRYRLTLIAVILFSAHAFSEEGALIDAMDAVSFSPPVDGDKKERGKVELVDGKVGKAIKFTFDDNCLNTNASPLNTFKATPDWDSAAGISFWVKGDGSDHLGGMQFVYNWDFATRYTVAFPIDSTEWKKIVIPWREMIPVLSKGDIKLLDPKSGNQPSKLTFVGFGKWWFWKDYAAHSFTIDDVRLEPKIELDAADYTPRGNPLARVQQKLKDKKPLTIVTMGDSLSAPEHWANKEVIWHGLLTNMIKEKYGCDVKIVNPSIGGTELLQGLVIIPRWLKQAPEPDLVVIFYGGNDRVGGVTPEKFQEIQKDAVERVRRATKGKADVMIMTTAAVLAKGDPPEPTQWELTRPIAEACRKAAAAKNAGLADVYAAFDAVPKDGREKLFGNLPGTTTCEGCHLGKFGHETVAKTVLAALESK
jgi:lysophospholipase L1-like esterase